MVCQLFVSEDNEQQPGVKLYVYVCWPPHHFNYYFHIHFQSRYLNKSISIFL